MTTLPARRAQAGHGTGFPPPILLAWHRARALTFSPASHTLPGWGLQRTHWELLPRCFVLAGAEQPGMGPPAHSTRVVEAAGAVRSRGLPKERTNTRLDHALSTQDYPASMLGVQPCLLPPPRTRGFAAPLAPRLTAHHARILQAGSTAPKANPVGYGVPRDTESVRTDFRGDFRHAL